MRQESGELSLTHPVDYESEHHLYHLLLKAMEVESTLSSVTEVHESLHVLPVVCSPLLWDQLHRWIAQDICGDAGQGGGLVVQEELCALAWVHV